MRKVLIILFAAAFVVTCAVPAMAVSAKGAKGGSIAISGHLNYRMWWTKDSKEMELSSRVVCKLR